MTVARVSHLSKVYSSGWIRTSFFRKSLEVLRGRPENLNHKVLDDVSFEINEGERWGLLGPNGSGKTTLLKVMSGILRPTSGDFFISGKVTPFFSWNIGFLDDLDGLENIFLYGTLLGMDRKNIKERLPDILRFSGLEPFLHAKLRTYSAGMKARLAFSVGLQTDAKLYLFDEIFSVSDRAFQDKCFEALNDLSKKGCAMIIASHDENLIRQNTGRCLVLEKGEAVKMGGTGSVLRPE